MKNCSFPRLARAFFIFVHFVAVLTPINLFETKLYVKTNGSVTSRSDDEINRKENGRFPVFGSHCRLEKPHMSFFHVVVLKMIATKNTKLRAARAARIFFLNSANQILNLWRCLCLCHRTLAKTLSVISPAGTFATSQFAPKSRSRL